MQRRVIAAVAAVVLAGLGAIMLFNYVSTADARAMANQQPTDVLVVTAVVPAGTPAEQIGPYIELKQLPKSAVAPGALTAIGSVRELVTSTQLEIGEQLLESRFVKPGVTTTGDIEVPKDMQQLTVQLGPSRTVGTKIQAGDKVALFISKEENQVALTKLAFRDVLVTKVQGAPDTSTEAGDTAPSTDVLVTFAIAPKNSTQVVWAAEFGNLWLALEPKEGDHTSTGVVRVKTVFG